MARQALRLTQEATPGTYASGSATIIRLTDSMSSRPKPVRWSIRDAGSLGRRAQTGSQQFETKLSVKTPLYYDQAAIILPAYLTPIVGPPMSLITFTADYVIEDDGGTLRYTRFLGCTPENLGLTATNQAQGVVVMTDMSFIYMGYDDTITSSDFAMPALTDYPSGQPAVFQHLKGQVSIGSSQSGFKSFGFTSKNVLDALYDENSTPSAVRYYGSRDIDWNVDLRYKSQAFRTDFEAVTAKAVTIALYNGTNTISFALHAKNFYNDLGDELSLDKAYYQKLSAEAYLDSAAGTDLTLAIS
jgi:hypothetical protein